jgi:hypothetical protein
MSPENIALAKQNRRSLPSTVLGGYERTMKALGQKGSKGGAGTDRKPTKTDAELEETQRREKALTTSGASPPRARPLPQSEVVATREKSRSKSGTDSHMVTFMAARRDSAAAAGPGETDPSTTPRTSSMSRTSAVRFKTPSVSNGSIASDLDEGEVEAYEKQKKSIALSKIRGHSFSSGPTKRFITGGAEFDDDDEEEEEEEGDLNSRKTLG